jgi:hypothetical protein
MNYYEFFPISDLLIYSVFVLQIFLGEFDCALKSYFHALENLENVIVGILDLCNFEFISLFKMAIAIFFWLNN